MKALSKTKLIRALKPCRAVTLEQTAAVLDLLASLVVMETKAGRPVRLPGFGVFVLGLRKGRIIRNPVTKELQHIPATKTVLFRAAKATKARVAR